MFFPVGDQNVIGGHKPIVSYTLIGINVVIFLYQIMLPQQQLFEFMMMFGAIPREIVLGENWLSLFTSMFLHGGWLHLLGNMMFLWVFADNIEAVVGNRNFLVFYILGGLAASLAHILFNFDSPVPAVGASGAISAVLGAYLVVFPHSRIRTLVFYFFVSIPALWFLGLWIIQQIISGIGSIGAVQTGGVAWWAHIGGFVFGVIAGFFIRRSYHPHEIEPFEP
ncbi:MAG: rhomboid family intramembrane serine protease [Saprospiraceae bacterium]|nr:rhomboid family intramembrane serine protease [Saprospiraceae bacterium]